MPMKLEKGFALRCPACGSLRVVKTGHSDVHGEDCRCERCAYVWHRKAEQSLA